MKLPTTCGQSARRAPILTVTFLLTSLTISGLPAHAQNTEVIEEIIVTGFRSSLKRSLDIKKDSVGIVDAISAEDLGKFPDRHLGESLQRVPGVTLQRHQDSNGEGRRISVRGLPDAFVRATLNGITAASSATDNANVRVRDLRHTFASYAVIRSVTIPWCRNCWATARPS